jgi:hypothetical protein
MVAHRPARSLIAGVASLLLLPALQAGAAPLKLQGIGEASVGFTDNVRTTPNNPALPGEPRSSSVFMVLSPGGVVAHEAPRAIQRLAYRFEYDVYFGESSASAASNRLDYRGFFDVAPRLALVLGAAATQSDRFSSIAFAAPGSGVTGVLPAGSGSFLQASADEMTSFDVNPRWRIWQGVGVVGDTPLFGDEGPRTLVLAGRTGVEHRFTLDAVGVEARGDYSVVKDGVASDGRPAGTQRQVVAGGVAQWRHDWGPDFTSSAEAGAVRLERLDSGRGFWSPVGAATLAYTQEFGDAQLTYSHGVTTNPLVGQSLVVDDVRLRGALPLLPKNELAVAASAGYQHGRLIDEDATLAARVNVVLIDVSLAWQATELIELGARYQHVRQMSDAEVPPLPLSFVQNNVLLGAVVTFPPERDMPRPYRAPRRVDRSDEIREGVRGPAGGPRAPGQLTR